MSELLVYQTFPDRQQALRTAATLENNGITVSVEDNRAPLDSAIIGQQYDNRFLLKIPGTSFADADSILEQQMVIDLNEVDKGYLLLSFTNEELIDVLKHKADWGIYNYKLAERILSDRKVIIPRSEIEEAHETRLAENARPQEMNVFWIALSYLLIVIGYYAYFSDSKIVIALGPVVYIIVFGYTLYFSKKTLSNGMRYPTYVKSARMHGLVFFISGIILMLVLFTLPFRLTFFK